ncbi:hypothetical protein ACQJBY_068054 [Aegilops geniculata]
MKYLSGSVDEKDRKIRDLKPKVEKRNLRVKGLTKGWVTGRYLLGSAYDQALLPTGSSVVHFLSWLKMHSTVYAYSPMMLSTLLR